MTEHLVIKYFVSITKEVMSSKDLETMAKYYLKMEEKSND